MNSLTYINVNFALMHKPTNAHFIMLFSYTYFVLYSLHLHVSVTPVTIFRVSYSKNKRSTVDVTLNAW
jgi:hypothetical protein